MKLDRPVTAAEVAKITGAEIIGSGDVLIGGINEIHRVEPGDLAFVDHPKYFDRTLNSAATAILINKRIDCPPNKVLLYHPDPFAAFNAAIRAFFSNQPDDQRISASARIGDNTYIHPSASVGNNAVIGSNCSIGAGVAIGHRCVVGNNVVIQANTVVGSDAFYYKKRPEGYDRLLSCGSVVIHDDVEIGAGCTIDRGVTDETVIGRGTKIDNQVHIGHDTRIGERCLIAAQVGIAGCVTIGDEVTIWGQVGCIANVTIGKGAVILAQSGVGSSLEAGKTYFGSPAAEAKSKMREMVALSHLVRTKSEKG
ncbi:MAG: UDP-3-O-(3-hydroxymyristoyl)glucosamine N-acyltransferase [Salibacteraceae bacterium]